MGKKGKSTTKKQTKKVVKKQTTKKETKINSKKKKGFTLIELLAVIIILGILMIIAIPSVTKYISDSRKNAYIDTAKQLIGAARNLVNSGKLEMYDTDTTYYIESSCIKTENASKSPYGEFTKAYVVITYDAKGYNYYWTSNDDTGQGIKNVVRIDKLDTDNIESDLKDTDISTLRGIDGRSKTVVVSDTNGCKKEGANKVESQLSGNDGKKIPVCKAATILHKKTCNRTDSLGCNVTGQAGYGNQIIYGTIISGSLKAGDALDCDVNNDGTYDSQTERFYYVTSDGNKSILIYYINMNDQATYAYDSSFNNWRGPVTAYQYLPSTEEWDNPLLISPGARQIRNENNGTSTLGGILPGTDADHPKFDYTGKAARFLTYQEVGSACGSSYMTSVGYLNKCTWLMENLGQYEEMEGVYSYWLQTPRSDDAYNSHGVWDVYGYRRHVASAAGSSSGSRGVRPVITVLTSNISN